MSRLLPIRTLLLTTPGLLMQPTVLSSLLHGTCKPAGTEELKRWVIFYRSGIGRENNGWKILLPEHMFQHLFQSILQKHLKRLDNGS